MSINKKGEIKDFVNNDTQNYSLNVNQEPGMKGSLKNANSASDAFILQYYEEPDGMTRENNNFLKFVFSFERLRTLKLCLC